MSVKGNSILNYFKKTESTPLKHKETLKPLQSPSDPSPKSKPKTPSTSKATPKAQKKLKIEESSGEEDERVPVCSFGDGSNHKYELVYNYFS